MFATATTSKLAQRTLDALRLTRSFLLLEDDYDVDWEVDLDERRAHHDPHRVALRGRARRSRRPRARRAGAPAPTFTTCLSPIASGTDTRPKEHRGATPERHHHRHERPAPRTRLL
jgi:hypothetical protein